MVIPYSFHTMKLNRNRGLKRSISFNEVTVRVYEQIIESHPCVRRGPGLGIGWEYNVNGTYLLEEYEKIFPLRTENEKKCPKLNPKERESILHLLGYTDEDIYKCVCEIHEGKDERLETAFEDSFLEITNDNECSSILKKDNNAKTLSRFLPRSHSDPVLQSSSRMLTKREKFRTRSISLPKILGLSSLVPQCKRSMKVPKHMRSSFYNKQN